jgi:hypothetical protein
VPYVIAEACIDIMDRSCVEECPVEVINQDRRVPDDQQLFVADNRRFFEQPLPGREDVLGAPGGSANVGPLGVDTELVAGHEPRD